MATKIYASGNYVIVETDTNIFEYAKGHTLYTLIDDVFYIKEITQGQFKVSVADLNAGNITSDDSGYIYNVGTFTTFLRDNTGFKTAPGGSGATPVGATLMKTGQTTSYRTGDDGDIEAGRETDFFILASNNPFGNTNRFTNAKGEQNYTNNIVIDWSTYNGSNVLGWRRTFSASGSNWDTAIDGALAVSIGSFTSGWRLPNANEICSLVNYSTSHWFNYPPFNSTLNVFLWTSTTDVLSTINALMLGYNTTNSTIRIQNKTNTSPRYIPCRTFTVTGTTLT